MPPLDSRNEFHHHNAAGMVAVPLWAENWLQFGESRRRYFRLLVLVCAEPRSSSLDQTKAQDFGQSGFAYLTRRCFGVIRHAHVNQDVAFGIESAIAGSRIIVAWLPDRADDGEPAPLREQRNFDGLYRQEPRGLSSCRQMIKLRHMDVSAKSRQRTRRHETAGGALDTGDVFPMMRLMCASVDEQPTIGLEG